MHDFLYLGLDAHTRNCTLTAINPSGDWVSVECFSTSETRLIQQVTQLSAPRKYLALEESSLAGWIAGVLRPYVTKLIV